MEATYGDGGWIRIRHSDLPGDLYLRMEDDGLGRLRARDVVLRGEWRPVVGADLRELPLPALEEWLQDDRDIIEAMPRPEKPLLGALQAAFPKGRPAGSGRPRVPRLQRPTQGLTDEFLSHVAAAYRQAVLDRKAPAPELARQVGDGATSRTIHKWVTIARQRGIMAPAAARKKG